MTKKPYKRATPEELKAREAVIGRMIEAGVSVPKIAQELGLGYTRIYDQIRRSPNLKMPPAVGPNPRRPGRRIGSVRQAITKQPVPFQNWLEDTLPVGVSFAEYIVSMAVDAYHDEVEEQKDAA